MNSIYRVCARATSLLSDGQARLSNSFVRKLPNLRQHAEIWYIFDLRNLRLWVRWARLDDFSFPSKLEPLQLINKSLAIRFGSRRNGKQMIIRFTLSVNIYQTYVDPHYGSLYILMGRPRVPLPLPLLEYESGGYGVVHDFEALPAPLRSLSKPQTKMQVSLRIESVRLSATQPRALPFLPVVLSSAVIPSSWGYTRRIHLRF